MKIIKKFVAVQLEKETTDDKVNLKLISEKLMVLIIHGIIQKKNLKLNRKQ